MYYVLKEEDLPGFVESLRQYFPESLQVYCQARNIMKRKCFWPGTEVLVDRYPDYSVCFTRPVPGEKDYIPRPRVWMQAVTLFAKTAEALRSSLQEESLIDWYRLISFISIPSRYVPVILEKAELTGYTRGVEEHYKSDVMIIRPEDLKSTTEPSLPAGCHIGKLDETQMDQIIAEWNFAGRGGNPEDAYPLFRYMLTHDFPNVGIFTEKNELIAYALYSPNGSISQGFVRESYRNQGLFQIVNRRLAEKIFRELGQEITWAHVHADNPASRSSFLKLGAKLHPTWKTQVLDYMPYM